MHQDVLGEAADAGFLDDFLALLVREGPPNVVRDLGLAEVRSAREAVEALAAGLEKAHHHRVTRCDRRDTGTHLLHIPGGLVPADEG